MRRRPVFQGAKSIEKAIRMQKLNTFFGLILFALAWTVSAAPTIEFGGPGGAQYNPATHRVEITGSPTFYYASNSADQQFIFPPSALSVRYTVDS